MKKTLKQKKISEDNKKLFSDILSSAGYDENYIYTYNMPVWWKEDYWGKEYYLTYLMAHLIQNHKIYIREDILDEVFDKIELTE